MASLPVTVFEASARVLPEYLPARMVNEFAYCPRLFFYEWVEGVFQESVDTIEGAMPILFFAGCFPRSRDRGLIEVRRSGSSEPIGPAFRGHVTAASLK